MKKYILSVILLISTIANSQTIKGKITSSKGKTLPFASIFIKGTSIGTTSDENGLYELKTNKNKVVLVASFTGHLSERKTISVNPSEEKIINFTLKETAEILDQITVNRNKNK